ncbi:UNVERIFIED_CONTAM: hypothetical protein NCL1_30792 [Trichonephila clavipes]
MVPFNLNVGAVESHHLSQCLDPADDLDGIFFHPELPVHVNKQTYLPAYLKQLALERVGDMPIDAVENKTAWLVPSEHHWYQCSRFGGSLNHGFKRQDQTLLARFRSGHLKIMEFSEGFKSFGMCTNCSSELASPVHIFECLVLTKQELADDPLLVLGFLEVYEVMDLV